jgi:acyl-[acyl-carrier-protein]-phospholipid O-acyltransferase/long-chain-fatty-acid--[acyl-carrier-protein] ligase
MVNHAKLPKGFHALTIAQSLGALNDNLFKTLLQLYVLQIMVLAHPETIMAQAAFIFTIPFILFGPWAGYVADRFDKVALIRLTKLAEIGIMLLGAMAFSWHNINLMLLVLFLLATQSAFFGPAKAGLIPEVCQPEVVNSANSKIEAISLVAIIGGIAVTGALLSWHHHNPLAVTYYGLGLAVIGAMSALLVPKPGPKLPSPPGQAFPWNPLAGIIRDLVFLKQRHALFLAGLANGYFWLLGLIFSTNIMVYGKDQLKLDDSQNTLLALLPALIGVGIAGGAILAGRWSGKKVELGLVPLGGVGMTLAGLALYFSANSYLATSLVLLLAGVSGGLFTVPLYAYLQLKAPVTERGRVLATVGIINGLCLLLGSLLYHLLAVEWALSPDLIFLLMGLVTAGVVIYTCMVIPQFFIRFLGWLLIHTLYRIEIIGVERVPERGPALLTPNHVSFVDALLISSTVQRFIRFVMIKSIYRQPLVQPILRLMDVIPIAPYEGRESVAQSLDRARERLQQGRVVCIFPEGRLTEDGQMQEFKPGFETIMQNLDCPIIPVYLHNVWGSIFSFAGGKYFWKWPKRLPYPITIYYGQPLPPHAKAAEVAAAVQALAEEIAARSRQPAAGSEPVSTLTKQAEKV